MATIPDSTDPGTQRPNKKPMWQLESSFELLQYTSCPAEINLSVSPDDAFALFQIFFPDDQLEIIAENTNKNAKNAQS